jgi:hypothetical protein
MSRIRRFFRPTRRTNDDGSILPLVMVGSFLIASIVAGVATYVSADLRYAKVVEERADRLAAADGGLRYGVEKLRNFQTLCTTKAGSGGGNTTVFPPVINGATTKVTCQRIGTLISDVQGWGVVVTGEGVPLGNPYFTTKGAGGSDNVKTFSGPVYINDPTRIDLQSSMLLKDGDLWYTKSNCDTNLVIPEIDTGQLTFEPDFFRGPQCTPLNWTNMFNPPTGATPPASMNTAPPYVDTATCRVFSPGEYDGAVPLADHNYFKAGVYYFEDTPLILGTETLIAGFPGSQGDAPKLDNTACAAEQQLDKNGGGPGGATFYLGGSSHIEVRNQAGFEIFRRKVNETALSIVAVSSNGGGYQASEKGWNDLLIETQSGNTSDVAIHGLVWAPRSKASLGNVTNAANGQILGGIVIANLDTQASASASSFLIGIETNPTDGKLLLISTATLNGISTTIRAVVQYRPDSGELAINSWRVVN